MVYTLDPPVGRLATCRTRDAIGGRRAAAYNRFVTVECCMAHQQLDVKRSSSSSATVISVSVTFSQKPAYTARTPNHRNAAECILARCGCLPPAFAGIHFAYIRRSRWPG